MQFKVILTAHSHFMMTEKGMVKFIYSPNESHIHNHSMYFSIGRADEIGLPNAQWKVAFEMNSQAHLQGMSTSICLQLSLLSKETKQDSLQNDCLSHYSNA